MRFSTSTAFCLKHYFWARQRQGGKVVLLKKGRKSLDTVPVFVIFLFSVPLWYTVPAGEQSCPGWWTLRMNIMAVQNNSLSRTIIINYNFNWHVIGSQNVLLIIAYRWTAVYQTAFSPVAELLMKRTVVTRTDYYPVTLVQVHNFLCTCTMLILI